MIKCHKKYIQVDYNYVSKQGETLFWLSLPNMEPDIVKFVFELTPSGDWCRIHADGIHPRWETQYHSGKKLLSTCLCGMV
jgi:hypothetical protein